MSGEEYVLRAGLDSRGFTAGANDMQRAMSGIQSASNTLRNALAALGVALSVQKIIQINTEFERLGAQLETVTGSVRGAGIAFKELEKFAAVTPFQLTEVVEAFTQLKARGLDPSIDSMQAWGDLASSMGRNVGDAIRAVGAATVGEMEALKSFGIQAVQAGDKVSFTFKGTTELVDRNARSIEDYLKRLATTNFGGSMERQSRTLGGAFSNLEDAVAGAVRRFGQGGFNDALRDSVQTTTQLVNQTNDLATALGEVAGKLLDVVNAAAKGASSSFSWIGATLDYLSNQEANSRSAPNSLYSQQERRRLEQDARIKAQAERMQRGAGFVADRFYEFLFPGEQRTPTDMSTEAMRARAEQERLKAFGGYGSLGEVSSEMAREANRGLGGRLIAPFKREDNTSASAQLAQLRNNLERQASFAPFVGPAGDLLKQLGDAQTGLNPAQLIEFARTGKLPETSETFTTGSRDALISARSSQFAIYQAERNREEQGRTAGIEGSKARAGGYLAGDVRAIEEATAKEKARQAVIRDGRDFEVEYRRQLEELDAKNLENAAQRINSTELQTKATVVLLDAVRAGVRDTSELEARNEALAAANENSAVDVEKLTQALIKQRKAQADLDYEKTMRQLQRTSDAAGQYTIVLNGITKQYEVQNRELEIQNRLTDELISKYGKDNARKMVEAQVDQAEAQRKVAQEAERTRLRIEANDWTAGAQRGLMRYQDTALNMAQNVENAVVNAFQSMEDALVNFVKTGKLDFKSLADSIITDLIRIQVRQMMVAAIGGAGGSGGGLFGSILGGALSLFGGGGPNAASGLAGQGIVPTASSFTGGFAVGGVARGGIFAGGNILPFARGGVVNNTTYFPMANGGMGMLGEAGPEAVLPLGRDSGGRLGVRSHGGGSQTIVQYSIDARGSQVGVERLIRKVISEEEPGIRQRAVRASMGSVTAEANRGGSFAKAVGRRSGK